MAGKLRATSSLAETAIPNLAIYLVCDCISLSYLPVAYSGDEIAAEGLRQRSGKAVEAPQAQAAPAEGSKEDRCPISGKQGGTGVCSWEVCGNRCKMRTTYHKNKGLGNT